jgi:hypothetical protein
VSTQKNCVVMGVETVTVTRPTIGQLIREFHILRPPFDPDGISQEIYQARADQFAAYGVLPDLWCTPPVMMDLLYVYSGAAADSARHTPMITHLYGTPVMLRPLGDPVIRALQQLPGVEMGEVAVLTHLSNTAMRAIHTLMAGEHAAYIYRATGWTDQVGGMSPSAEPPA